MTDQDDNKIEQIADLIIANKENAMELHDTFRELTTPKESNDMHLAELIVSNEENASALVIANKKLDFQHEESDKQTAELVNAYRDLKVLEEKIAFQREEKTKRADELVIANKELAYQNKEKEKRASEFIDVNKVFVQSEENFRRSISESPLGIRIISVKGETIYVNKSLLEIYGLNSLQEFRNIAPINRYTPESYKEHIERKEKIKNGQEIYDYEFDILRSNGEIRHVKAWRKEVLWNGTIHYQVISLDITEQKRMEETLYTTQQELRNFAIHLQNIREEEKNSIGT